MVPTETIHLDLPSRLTSSQNFVIVLILFNSRISEKFDFFNKQKVTRFFIILTSRLFAPNRF